MARTFRRKNFEAENNNSWWRGGRKTAGFYTESDYSWGLSTYREPTEAEYNNRYRDIHGESKSSNSRSPGKSYRKPRTREWRQQARQELHKFRTREDYDVLLPSNPVNCWWDWS